MDTIEIMQENARRSAKLAKDLELNIIAVGKSNPNAPLAKYLDRYAAGLILVLAKRHGKTVREMLTTCCLESLTESCLEVYYGYSN